ncbi:hypothetical protein HIM_10950 [Hirsutella minnesotensis 3608]|uniref:HAT C-terminal dimerisation domain-containing protein n=1 Tax=Hirsutella minnesotensis 3608 TaxID=1043627 RepID=A0A0F7ZJI3_9HYPO|nr:hypothetical protein HIM_10950 [Hirsutella minnesotensis 3608]
MFRLGKDPAERAKLRELGVKEESVRISAGLEDVQDLIDTLKDALVAATRAKKNSRDDNNGAEKEKAFAAVKSHKRLKLRHEVGSTDLPAIDLLDQFLETDVIRLGEDEAFDVIKYWNDRYHTQSDLARMALDVLAVPPMSDECERLFSSAKILLSDRRSRLKIDIIEASECFRYWYGPPVRNTFEDTNIGKLEGESDLQETYQAGDGS